jgi:hypothetical protein
MVHNTTLHVVISIILICGAILPVREQIQLILAHNPEPPTIPNCAYVHTGLTNKGNLELASYNAIGIDKL